MTAPQWVMLAYRLPRDPSTPRITLWRKLRRLGVVQLLDGLVALPADARTQEALEWLADEVLEAGGEATVWLSQPTTVGQQRQLESIMAQAAATEYRAVIEAAQAAAQADPASQRRTVARLRRELARITQRDHYPPPERERARRAVD
jgi:hypothetical protein